MRGALRRRGRRDPLAGDGPIASRARTGLRRVAAQFGEIVADDRTSVTVRTADGVPLRLGYTLGDYVFSRVYNLTVTARVPDAVPAGLELSHRGRGGARFVARSAARNSAAQNSAVQHGPAPAELERLAAVAGSHLDGIDLVSARTSGADGARTATFTPLGGSFVWVLIPPVFQTTAFPPGEPDRIAALVRELRAFGSPAAAAR